MEGGGDGPGRNENEQGQISQNPRQRVCRVLYMYQLVIDSVAEHEGRPVEELGYLLMDVLAYQAIRDRGLILNGVGIVGPVPGISIGDAFRYRSQMVVVGLHRPLQGRVDIFTARPRQQCIALSVVTSPRYDIRLNPDTLIYRGVGGQSVGRNNLPRNQVMIRGNLALYNSVHTRNPIRVIHTINNDDGTITYIYDGIFVAENYWVERIIYVVSGIPVPRRVYKFRLRRLPN